MAKDTTNSRVGQTRPSTRRLQTAKTQLQSLSESTNYQSMKQEYEKNIDEINKELRRRS